MPEVPADLNVFRRPHSHMKQLVKDIEEELHLVNFCDGEAFHSMLGHLTSRFREFKSHEDIENQYIVKELVPRLPSHTLATLQNDLHSDNRLNELVIMVDRGLELREESESKLTEYGEELKTSIYNFNLDFIPHMDEEEQVFLPLLVEHFSEAELRTLTAHVLELHHLMPSPPHSPELNHQPSGSSPAVINTDNPHLLTLPAELQLQIFSYLSPQDLLHVSQVHPHLKQVALDGSLWRHIHPVRWTTGRWQFFKPPDISNKSLLLDGLIEENDITKDLLTAGTAINANLMKSRYGNEDDDICVQQEMEVLIGVIDHILPMVGHHVYTLDLSHGKAVTNEIVYRMLRLCPNLKYLDLSHTKISDFALKGLLCKNHHHRCHLEYLDLSNCSSITDLSLQRLAQALLKSPTHSSSLLPCCAHHMGQVVLPPTTTGAGGGGGCGDGCDGGDIVGTTPRLKCLLLSGCHQVTDTGLRYLSSDPGLPMLQYLNLSGLPRVTQQGLSPLVATTPQLTPDLLFYCDNITAGPYADTANGCQNSDLHSNLHCCRMCV